MLELSSCDVRAVEAHELRSAANGLLKLTWVPLSPTGFSDVSEIPVIPSRRGLPGATIAVSFRLGLGLATVAVSRTWEDRAVATCRQLLSI